MFSKFENIEWVKYSITFSGILLFRMIELDFEDFKGQSSFDEVINSDWISEMRKNSSGKLTPNHKHYFLQTYDDIFDIVCSSYDLKLVSE